MNMHKQIDSIVKKAGLKLEWIDNGIGTRRGNTIVLNKNLLNYPEYCMKVLSHETRHSSSYIADDIMMDLTEASLWDNLAFCLKHPKGFATFVPIDYYKGDLYIDYTTILVYLITIISITAFIVLL